MPREEDFSFSFVSQALAEETFTVAEIKGTEGISMLYNFEIMLYAEDPEIDLKAVLQSPATLTIIPEGEDERKIHGIPALFEQLQEYDDHIFYRLKLVPRLWFADQYQENMLFLEKSVPDIIEEILPQVGLTSDDYELRLNGSYQPWEYICQYNETDFDFLSRWMEREGIYYFFDQSGDSEKLIIADSSTAHQPIEGSAVLYSPPGVATPAILEQIKEFTCRQQILPQKVILKDYNYRRPSLDLKGEADVDSEGRGNVYIYGEHFKTPEEGNALARIRAEELLCREVVFYGDGTVSPLMPGYIFELDEHYRDSYNQRYLITDITHQGVQADYLSMTADTSRITQLETPAYNNQFSCMPENVQFRPERKTQKPRIDGTLNAKVDAEGDGEYAEIDDEGRYKIKLPFDQSDAGDGKASRYVRMAQPYAGSGYGMHFPLHKGIEVLLTFIDGDPDRPIIASSVPNPETASPVTSANHTQSMIQTNYGHNFIMDDANPHWEINTAGGHHLAADDGGQDNAITIVTNGAHKIHCSDTMGYINMETPGVSEQITMYDNLSIFMASGTENWIEIEKAGKVSIDAKTEIHAHVGASNMLMKTDHLRFWNDGYNVRIDSGQIKLWKGGNGIRLSDAEISTTAPKETHTINGQRTVTVNGNETYTVTGAQTKSIASENAFWQGAKGTYQMGAFLDFKLALALDIYAGIKLELKPSLGIELAGIKIGQTAVNIAKDHIKIEDGALVIGETTLIDNRLTRLFA